MQHLPFKTLNPYTPKDMKLTIVTINYNNREGLEKTLRSVTAQLTADTEYVVIDGGSTDGSVELIQQYAKHIAYWVSEPDKGIYNAMNKAIKVAKGEYINFMNSGDTFYSAEVLPRVVPLLNGKDFYIGDEKKEVNGKVKIFKSPDHIKFASIARRAMRHQATFIRTQLLKDRPYNEEYKIASDWEQMFYELIFNNATYEHLPFIVSLFDANGVSSQEENYNLQQAECHQIRATYLPPLICKHIEGEGNEYVSKIVHALGYDKPLKRDLKVLRNALKMLFADLFKKRG